MSLWKQRKNNHKIMEEYLVAKVTSSANYLSICLMEEMVLGKLLKKTLVMYRHMIKQKQPTTTTTEFRTFKPHRTD